MAVDRVVLFVGDAAGVDAATRAWAELRWHTIRVFAASWDEHGRAAGPRRNQTMVNAAAAQAANTKRALAFLHGGSVGTRVCVKRLARAGLHPAIHHRDQPELFG